MGSRSGLKERKKDREKIMMEKLKKWRERDKKQLFERVKEKYL
jgi:hypothetical protein